MWDDHKQQRLNDLQRRAEHGALADDERQALDDLLHELEQAEWAAIRPTLSQLRQEQEGIQAGLGQLRAQNAVLAGLTEQYADLLARAKAQLAGLISEREALRTEYERVQR